MANYRDIKGFTVQSLDTDPVPYSGTWSSGTSINTASYYRAYMGTQTASLLAGGEPGSLDAVEKWNGSTWTEVNEINTARSQLAGAGTTTAGLAFGGKTPGSDTIDATEEYDGTNWTEQGND